MQFLHVIARTLTERAYSFRLYLVANSEKVFLRTTRVSEALPQTYLLDANGRLVYRTAGMDTEGYKKALLQLGFR